MKLIKSVQEMMSISDRERAKGKSIRLVPTMGALHRGHLSLIKMASRRNSKTPERNDISNKNEIDAEQNGEEVIVIVSVFVNPLQFNNSDDYSKYPDTMEADLALCEELDVAYVFAPDVKEMYPHIGSSGNQCLVRPPDHLAKILEGESRPGHFEGMLTVVCKLFNITKPHEAYFGEKDYQQLLLVNKMSQDLSMDIQIVPVETVRDHDMLPLSSRNIRLTQQQRIFAPLMYKILLDARRAIREFFKNRLQISSNVAKLDLVLTASRIATLSFDQSSGDEPLPMKVDYLQLRCSKDLSELKHNRDMDCFDCNLGCVMQQVTMGESKVLKARLLTSVIIDNVRLLDNIEVLLNR